jgi:hypothetical protein
MILLLRASWDLDALHGSSSHGTSRLGQTARRRAKSCSLNIHLLQLSQSDGPSTSDGAKRGYPSSLMSDGFLVALKQLSIIQDPGHRPRAVSYPCPCYPTLTCKSQMQFRMVVYVTCYWQWLPILLLEANLAFCGSQIYMAACSKSWVFQLVPPGLSKSHSNTCTKMSWLWVDLPFGTGCEIASAVHLGSNAETCRSFGDI